MAMWVSECVSMRRLCLCVGCASLYVGCVCGVHASAYGIFIFGCDVHKCVSVSFQSAGRVSLTASSNNVLGYLKNLHAMQALLIANYYFRLLSKQHLSCP